jgi:DNA-binding MarR family transcriptional regulator
MTASRLLEETRLLARALRAWRSATEADGPIRGAMRGVLEHLQTSGPSAVPAIARAERVSRQTIQVQVDALLELGMVRRNPNPAHSRSSLIALTDSGHAWVEDTRARERNALACLQVGVSDTAVRDATRVLVAWRHALTIVHSEE